MHCPHCRQDNAATTRFCTACGAVLVENTRDGGRRRVLRPWGLRSAAPLTESPAMPDLAAARRREARPRWSRRLDLRVAAGTVIVALAGTFLYPYARALEGPRDAAPAMSPPIVLTAASTYAVREALLVAPPLVELVEAPALRPRTPTAAQAAASRDTANRRAAIATELPASAEGTSLPPNARAPARETPAVVALAPPLASPPDRWVPLRQALARCGERDGVFERASCEEAARIRHCADYWGQASLCPAGRQDHGQ